MKFLFDAGPILVNLDSKVDNYKAKPRVSLTAPNHDHFAQVSLKLLDFLDANAKAKKLIRVAVRINKIVYSTESQASFTDKEVF